MNSRNDFTRRVAGFRWWGCVLLSMFAVVQTARGAVEPASRPEPARPDNTLGLIGHFRLQYDIRYRTAAPDIPGTRQIEATCTVASDIPKLGKSERRPALAASAL